MFGWIKQFYEQGFTALALVAMGLSFLLGISCAHWIESPSEAPAKQGLERKNSPENHAFNKNRFETQREKTGTRKINPSKQKKNSLSSKSPLEKDLKKKAASNASKDEDSKSKKKSESAKNKKNKKKKSSKNNGKAANKKSSRGFSKKTTSRARKNRGQYQRSVAPGGSNHLGSASLPRPVGALNNGASPEQANGENPNERISSSSRRSGRLGRSETEKIVSEFSSHLETLPIGSQISDEERNSLTAKLLSSQAPEDSLVNHRLGFRTIFQSESPGRDPAQEDSTLSNQAWHFANWAAGFESSFPEGVLDPSFQEENIFFDRASRVSRFYTQQDFMGPLFTESAKSLQFKDKVIEKEEPGPFIHQHRQIFNELRFQYADLDSFEVTEVVMDQEDPASAKSEFQRCYDILLEEENSISEAKEEALKWIKNQIDDDEEFHPCDLQA